MVAYKVSASRLNQWIQCPMSISFKLQGYPTNPVEEKYIRNGLAVHNLLEDRVKGIVKEPEFYWNEQNVPEEMRGVFSVCVENAKQFFDCGGVPEETILKEFKTPKGRDVLLEARLDLIVDGKIVDYKTGKSVDKAEYKLQGQVYHFATDFKYDTAEFISLQNNSTMSVSQPPKDFIPKLCDKYIDSIEENKFPKKQSPLCRYCPYERFCMGDLQYEYVEDVKANPEKYGVVNPQWRK